MSSLERTNVASRPRASASASWMTDELEASFSSRGDDPLRVVSTLKNLAISPHTQDLYLPDRTAWFRDHHEEVRFDLSWESVPGRTYRPNTPSARHLQQQASNANDYFIRRGTEVFNDEEALKLLAALYADVVVETKELDLGEQGLAMAKLTAADFCEVGADVIYITEAGQRFIRSIEGAWQNLTTRSKTE